uniref:Uncharacterized protein n=1 Tax=Timema poppense TaxID=170557 RepID=A0A7R9DNB7_TIMPO|nr:unnamed protein product [Timema poppensis]
MHAKRGRQLSTPRRPSPKLLTDKLPEDYSKFPLNPTNNQEDKHLKYTFNMNSLVVFLMVLMVSVALIQGTWSAPQTRPQISADDIGSVIRAIISRIASSGI